ncbi:hypothetical protein [Actinoplanes philippinensis]|uniref:hypothetical protein n=1 Tax=Actinoplanes philippinensis TaxID=35752 RepID=UPI0033FD0D82
MAGRARGHPPAADADAGAFGEVVINATSGVNSLAALHQVGRDNLAGKVLLDVANSPDPSGPRR